MNIPDCREDEYYNQKYLNASDKKLIDGFDISVRLFETSIENFDIYEEEFNIDGEDINLVRFFNNHPKIKSIFKGCLLDMIESNRDALIVSMIDAMTDEEYESIRKEVDGESD